MIDKKALEHNIKRDLKTLTSPKTITIRSFKKDRMVRIYADHQQWSVEEDGFVQTTHTFASTDPTRFKRLKKILEHEFPRSNKLWYQLKD